jgi:hypothetical protein
VSLSDPCACVCPGSAGVFLPVAFVQAPRKLFQHSGCPRGTERVFAFPGHFLHTIILGGSCSPAACASGLHVRMITRMTHLPISVSCHRRLPRGLERQLRLQQARLLQSLIASRRQTTEYTYPCRIATLPFSYCLKSDGDERAENSFGTTSLAYEMRRGATLSLRLAGKTCGITSPSPLARASS